MKLEKAIPILSILIEVKARMSEIDQHDAIKLGLEALLRIEQERTLHTYPAYKLLPSETPGNDKDTSFRHNAHIHHNERRLNA